MHKQIELETHPGAVEIKFDGITLAETNRSLLLIETWAPDIYIPIADIQMQHLRKAQTQHNEKPGAIYWDAQVNNCVTTNIMWTYDKTRNVHTPINAPINAYAAFDFSQVETFVDGQLVRGHVRDPNKIIKTELLNGNLVIHQCTEKIVDTNTCVILYEAGLPERYYIPASDVYLRYLVPSTRQSVCTYKGEAIYYHVKTNGQVLENAVWSYPDPWLDFSADIDNIRGLMAFYTSAFDSVSINDNQLQQDEATNRTDAHMIGNPTIDETLGCYSKYEQRNNCKRSA